MCRSFVGLEFFLQLKHKKRLSEREAMFCALRREILPSEETHKNRQAQETDDDAQRDANRYGNHQTNRKLRIDSVGVRDRRCNRCGDVTAVSDFVRPRAVTSAKQRPTVISEVATNC